MHLQFHQIDAGTPDAVRPSEEGSSTSASRVLAEYEGESIRLGTWIAEPGTYSSGGAPGGECFVVLSGDGRLFTDKTDPVHLSAGTVVTLGANVPSQIRVDSTLSKVSVIRG